jgi:uncharacterized protein (DUF433 family)
MPHGDLFAAYPHLAREDVPTALRFTADWRRLQVSR